MNYQEHLDWLHRQEAGARAERYGFVDAKAVSVTAGPMRFDTDYEQMRYRQGCEDGKAMLWQDNLNTGVHDAENCRRD